LRAGDGRKGETCSEDKSGAQDGWGCVHWTDTQTKTKEIDVGKFVGSVRAQSSGRCEQIQWGAPPVRRRRVGSGGRATPPRRPMALSCGVSRGLLSV